MTVKLALPLLVLAMSVFPSPLKSPSATPWGFGPIPLMALLNVLLPEKPPAPLPNRTVRVPGLVSLATTMSGKESSRLLKFPTAIPTGFGPAGKLVAALKVPPPWPNRIVTWPLKESVTATSGTLSLLKSATATNCGWAFAGSGNGEPGAGAKLSSVRRSSRSAPADSLAFTRRRPAFPAAERFARTDAEGTRAP